MLILFNYLCFQKVRPTVIVTITLGLFFVLGLQSDAHARETVRKRSPERISQAEGRTFIENFRRQRLQGDYCFKFVLEHLPRRGKTIRYKGTVWGSWNEKGPISRFVLDPPDSNTGMDSNSSNYKENAQHLEWIVQNGVDAQVWTRSQSGEPFKIVSEADLWKPLFEGVLYRPFDLLMPFIYWSDWDYKGPKVIGSRVVQEFCMYPPKKPDAKNEADETNLAPSKMHAVKVSLDNDYNALLRIEILDAKENALTRFDVESFKKVSGQYIVKRITLSEEATGNRTRFRVYSAAINLNFLPSIFDPKNTDEICFLSEENFSEL